MWYKLSVKKKKNDDNDDDIFMYIPYKKKDSSKNERMELEHEGDPGHNSKTKCIKCWRNAYRAQSWRLWACACRGSTAPAARAWTTWTGCFGTSGRGWRWSLGYKRVSQNEKNTITQWMEFE